MQEELREIAVWLAALAGDVLQRQSVDVTAPFDDRYTTAAASARLTAEIMRRRNLSLPEGIVDRYPSPLLLAEWMCRNADRIYDPVIPFHGSEPTSEPSEILFCVHPVSGVGTVYKNLAEYLTPGFRTFALHARGINPGETQPASFDEIVSQYADRVEAISNGTPPHLLGWSFGGQIAQAVAIELQRRGHSTGLLILIDSWISDEALAKKPPALPTYEELLREKYAQSLPDLLCDFDMMDDEARLRGFVGCLIELEAVTQKASRMPYPAIRRLTQVYHRLDGMFRRSVPQPYAKPAIMVRGADNADWGVDVVAQYTAIASDLAIEDLPHPHLVMLIRDESIQALAAIVSRRCAEFAGRKMLPPSD